MYAMWSNYGDGGFFLLVGEKFLRVFLTESDCVNFIGTLTTHHWLIPRRVSLSKVQ